MAEAKLEISGNTDQAQKELDKLVNKVAGLTEKMRQMKEGSKAAAKESTNSFDGMAMSVGRMAAGFVSVGAAAAAVTAELREQQRIQDKIAQTQIRAAGTQAQFLRNLGIASPGERGAALSGIGDISKATGVKQSDLFSAASVAMSARGDRSVTQALGAVGMAARVAPESPNELSAVAGGLLDIGTLTGTNDWRANLGKLVATGQQARVTSLESVSRNLVPGAIGLKGFGATDTQALAAVSTLTQAMKDPEGAMSGTAGIALGQQLEKFLPNVGTFQERLSQVQASDSLRKRFMSRSSFEKKAIVPVRELLTGGSETAKLYAQNLAGMPTGEGAGATADEFLSGLMQPDIQKTADKERRLGAIVEGTELKRIGAADASTIRRQTMEQLSASGASWLHRGIAGFEFMVGPESMAANTAVRNLDAQRAAVKRFGSGSDADAQVIAKLTEMIDAIKQGNSLKGVNVDAHTE